MSRHQVGRGAPTCRRQGHPQWHRSPTLGLSIAFLTLAACAGTAPDEVTDACAAARALRESPSFLGVAREADVAAQVVPGGFGSLWQDFSAGQLVVYLKDLTKASEARTTLQIILECGAAYPSWADTLVNLSAMTFREGQYTGTELLSYLQALESLRNDPSVWALEVDPERNRIWVGLKEASAEARVRTAVASASVPLASVVIEPPPPSTGAEWFTVRDTTVTTPPGGAVGILELVLSVQFSNRASADRQLEQCLLPGAATLHLCHYLERWDGGAWKRVLSPLYVAIAVRPRTVTPSEFAADAVQLVASRRLNSAPEWGTARITGTYRLVGRVYLNQLASPPFVADPVPEAERVSAPFRLLNLAPL